MLEELKRVEEIFDVHIDVFGLRELTGNDKNRGGRNKTRATVVRLSDRPSDRSVALLLEIDENRVGHYYLVNDTNQLLKKLVCEHCNSIQKNITQNKNHISKCIEGRVRHLYPGGFHKQPLGIREKLASVGIKIPEHIAYYDEFICYDFEAMFKHITEKSEKTQYISKHCPVSYAICDSLGETVSQCHEDPEQLIILFLKDVLRLRKKLVNFWTEDFRGYLIN